MASNGGGGFDFGGMMRGLLKQGGDAIIQAGAKVITDAIQEALFVKKEAPQKRVLPNINAYKVVSITFIIGRQVTVKII